MRYILIMLIFVTTNAAAEIYKCTNEKGKPEFSDKPCGSDAEVIEVVNDSVGLNMSGGDFSNIKASNDRRENSRQVKHTRNRISNLQAEKREALAKLDRRAARANNNLAGATYLKSIADEKQAVIADYNAQIEYARDEIKEIQNRSK